MSCDRCAPYFGEWRSHSPIFPEEAWEILSFEEFPVGTHGGATGMSGRARCRACGLGDGLGDGAGRQRYSVGHSRPDDAASRAGGARSRPPIFPRRGRTHLRMQANHQVSSRPDPEHRGRQGGSAPCSHSGTRSRR